MSKFTSTILITGGTLGLGYQAALQIAKKHPEYLVVISSRSDSKSAAAGINKATGNNNTIFLPLDLSNLSKVRSFADDYLKRDNPPIKALLLNAALQFPGQLEFSDDGFEKTIAITHLGNALLFYLLRPQLANDARIVITSSGTHDPKTKSGMPDADFTTAEKLGHPDPKTATKDGRQRYTTSKLCNVLWTYALHHRLTQGATQQKKWTVTAFEPGLMPGTGLGRNYGAVFRFLWNHVLPNILPLLRVLLTPNIHTPQESGGNLARLAISSELEGVSGVYVDGVKETPSSDVSYDKAKQDELYDWTLAAITANASEREAFEKLYA